MLPSSMEETSSPSASTSDSKSMAVGALILHAHKRISLYPSSRDPSRSSFPPPLNSNSDEIPNPTLKTPRVAEDDSSTFSANVIAENEDILTLILLCLPARSLFRFQSVSKRWLSIISSSSFRQLRLWRRTGAHFMYARGKDGTPEFNFISRNEAYIDSMTCTFSGLTNLFDVSQILGFHSCNGLVAIALKSADNHVNFYVYNPTTCEHRLIPLLYVHDIDYNNLDRGESGYGFDMRDYIEYDPETNEVIPPVICPQTLSHFVALNIAFDPSQSGYYKLIYVWYDGHYIRFSCYASDTEIWKTIRWFLDEQPTSIGRYLQKGVFWNGNLFWTYLWWHTLCLDLKTGNKRPHTPSIPGVFIAIPGQQLWPDVYFFGLIGDDLCRIGLTDPHSLMFRVYNLELDYSRWNLKYCLDIFPVTTLYQSMVVEEIHPYFDIDWWWDCKFSVLNCLVDEKRKKSELLISIRGKIISFDMEGMVVNEIADVVPETASEVRRGSVSRFEWMHTFEHFETFASV